MSSFSAWMHLLSSLWLVLWYFCWLYTVRWLVLCLFVVTEECVRLERRTLCLWSEPQMSFSCLFFCYFGLNYLICLSYALHFLFFFKFIGRSSVLRSDVGQTEEPPLRVWHTASCLSVSRPHLLPLPYFLPYSILIQCDHQAHLQDTFVHFVCSPAH